MFLNSGLKQHWLKSFLSFSYRRKDNEEDPYADIRPRSSRRNGHHDNPVYGSSSKDISHTTNPLFYDSRAPTPQPLRTRQDSMASITPSVFLDIYAKPVLRSQRTPPSYTQTHQSTKTASGSDMRKVSIEEEIQDDRIEEDNDSVFIKVPID